MSALRYRSPSSHVDAGVPRRFDPRHRDQTAARAGHGLFFRSMCAADQGGSGIIKAYSDELSQLTAGANGAHRMKGALAVIGLHLMKGEIDPVSGRGKVGPPESVLTEIAGTDPLMPSNPTPFVTITSINVSGVTRNSGNALVANIQIEGEVVSPLADIVPDSEADLTDVELIVAGMHAADIQLTRVAESESILRPFACKFTFQTTVSGVKVVNGPNELTIKAVEPMVDTLGYGSASFTVLASNNQKQPREPSTSGQSLLFGSAATGIGQPIQVRINFSDVASLEDAISMGPNAFECLSKIPFVTPITVKTESVGVSMEAGSVIIKNTDGSLVLKIANGDALDLGTSGPHNFIAHVTTPIFPESRDILFTRTANNIYESVIAEVNIGLPSGLSEAAVDVLTGQQRSLLWNSASIWEAISLTETGVSTNIFEDGQSHRVVIASEPKLSTRVSDVLKLRLSGLASFTGNEFYPDVSESSANSRQFNSGSIFSEAPLAQTYLGAWLSGPLEAHDVQVRTSSSNGTYAPVLIRIESPDSLRDQILSHKVRVFGQAHDVIEYQGDLYCSGSDSPGNFVGVGRLAERIRANGTFGAGHLNSKDGYIFGTMEGSLFSIPEKGRTPGQVQVLDVAGKLWKEMRYEAGKRRTKRLYTTATHETYAPPFAQGNLDLFDPQRDALGILSTFMFSKYRLTPSLTFDLNAVRDMSRHTDPPIFDGQPAGEPAGIPGGSTQLYWDAVQTPILSIGSRFLIGHNRNGTFDQKNDFSSRWQNNTQILHFNNGMGWAKKAQDVAAFLAIYESTTLSEGEKKTQIMDFLVEKKWLPKDLEENLQSARNSPLPDGVVFSQVEKHDKFQELVDVITLLRAFGGQEYKTIDVFMAYDLASFEGFHIFSMDSFNDVIATEAGAIFAERIEAQPAANVNELKDAIEFAMKEARKRFLNHKVFRDRVAITDSFASMMIYSEGGECIPVREKYWDGTGVDGVVWKKTLGMVIERNIEAGTLADDPNPRDPDRKRREFVKLVMEHLRGANRRNAGLPPYLTSLESDSLDAAIELLSLVDETIPGTRD